MSASESERWEYVLSLDDELLMGSSVTSEWATLLICDADTAYCHGAPIASILVSIAAIEAHVRFELQVGPADRRPLAHLIDSYGGSADLRAKVHELRRARNAWTHVRDPYDDQHLVNDRLATERELDGIAREGLRTLRRVLYLYQGT